MVLRYGQAIGRAKTAIAAGQHIHTHNLSFEELDLDYEFPAAKRRFRSRPQIADFLGYAREDGRAGTRNYIAVVAASNCAAHTAETSPAATKASAAAGSRWHRRLSHGEGCGHSMGPDVDQLQPDLGGVLLHPNVSAAMILGLGCEVNQIDHYLGQERRAAAGWPALRSNRAAERGRQWRRRGGEIAPLHRTGGRGTARTEIPASKIVLGLNCGGSDSFWGITANPALGTAPTCWPKSAPPPCWPRPPRSSARSTFW